MNALPSKRIAHLIEGTVIALIADAALFILAAFSLPVVSTAAHSIAVLLAILTVLLAIFTGIHVTLFVTADGDGEEYEWDEDEEDDDDGAAIMTYSTGFH